MRYLVKITGLCLVAVFAVGMVAAGTAQAKSGNNVRQKKHLQHLLCTKPINVRKLCLAVNGPGRKLPVRRK